MSRSTEQDLLSTEIVNRGIEPSGPNAGSPTFSVRVRRRLPDFLQSVNLKYVKLGYHYLINHAVYLATIPVLVLVFSAEVGSLSREEIWKKLWDYDLATVIGFFGVFVLTVCVYFMSRPRSVYLIDFACFKPSDELKVRLHASNLVLKELSRDIMITGLTSNLFLKTQIYLQPYNQSMSSIETGLVI